MDYENILVEIADGVGVITLDRPRVLNALSEALYQELDAALTAMERDDDVRAIVLTGSGNRAFSAGGDIHEMAKQARDGVPMPNRDRERRAWHIAECVKPTIGAINGLAYGGGAVLAASLDIRIGCENTSFRFLAASYGRVNSTWNLPMQVGWPVAKELLFTARVVEADEAYRIGLLNHLVRSDQLMDKATETARLIASNDPRMVQGVKELLLRDVGSDWEGMYRNENQARAGSLAPTPVLEGFKDFLERKGARE